MVGENQDFQKRMPSIDRKISEIKAEDIRVAVIGTVIDNQENRVIVDDGSGKLNVSFEENVDTDSGKIVRVLGRVIPMDSGVELQGDFLQDMTGLDMSLKKKVDEVLDTKKV